MQIEKIINHTITKVTVGALVNYGIVYGSREYTVINPSYAVLFSLATAAIAVIAKLTFDKLKTTMNKRLQDALALISLSLPVICFTKSGIFSPTQALACYTLGFTSLFITDCIIYSN